MKKAFREAGKGRSSKSLKTPVGQMNGIHVKERHMREKGR